MKTLLGVMLCSFAIGMIGFACTSDNGSGDSDSDSDSDSDVDADDCEGGKYDESNGLCWQDPRADGVYKWQEARDYCDDLDLAGHTAWYLPTWNDFTKLLGGCDSDVMSGEWGYCNSCEENETCSALFGSDSDWDTLWSSSPEDSDHAWAVSLEKGYVSFYDVSDYIRVRCVR